MKKNQFFYIFFSLILILGIFQIKNISFKAQAQAPNTIQFVGNDLENLEAIEATAAASASESSSLASPSAEVVEKIQKKTDEDITETSGKQKSLLAAYLDEHPIGKLSPTNFIQKTIRKAISEGLPANIIVILLIFPIIASIVAFARHVVGLKGFGIYIPAVLSVAFVSTGIVTGIILFLAVLLSAILTRKLLRFLKMPLLPKTAMLLLGVSMSMLALLILGTVLNIDLVINVSIFPLLIIILLTENFMETQMFSSQGEAFSVTFETLVLAVICSFLVDNEAVQKFVILRPELSILAVTIINLAIARYTGLRIFEYFRFKNLLNEKNSFKSLKGFSVDDIPEGEEE